MSGTPRGSGRRGFVALERVAGHEFALFEEVGHTQRLFELLVELFVLTRNLDILPELFPHLPYLDERLFKGLFGTGHAYVLPHDVAEFLVDFVHRLLALDGEKLLDACTDVLLRFGKFRSVGIYLRRLDVMRQIIADV